MDSKVNFTLVGIFLFTFILALVGFTFWLGKYNIESKKVDFYKVYLNESIAGLNIESSIKYKGLNIGVVRDIKINTKNSEQIEVLLEVNGGTPIKVDTVAVLEVQGITGLKYIDLMGGSKNATLLLSNTNKIPTIKSQPSLLGSLGNSAQNVSQNVNSLLDKLNILFNENNIKQISNTLQNTDNLINTLNTKTPVLYDKIGHAIVDLDKFTKNINLTLSKLDTLIDSDVKKTLQNISNTSTSAQVTFEQLSTEIRNGKFDLKEITNSSLKRFDELMIEWDITMQNAQTTIDKYNDSPSDIIFKSRADTFGPGEKDE